MRTATIARKVILISIISFLALARCENVRASTDSGTPNSLITRNWAGYVVNATAVTSINASWTIPAIQCSLTAPTTTVLAGVRVWIGFDGLGRPIPERIGTDSFCYNSAPFYSAWEEDPTLPSGVQTVFPGSQLTAGDRIITSITYLGNNRFMLSISDTTIGDAHSFSVSVPGTARASVEWIVEDPWSAQIRNYLALPPFQSVSFNGCTAGVRNVVGSIVQNNAVSISMADNSGNVLAAPQGLNQAGTSFQVVQVSES